MSTAASATSVVDSDGSSLPPDFEDEWTEVPRHEYNTTVRARVVTYGPKYCKVAVLRPDYNRLCTVLKGQRVPEHGRLYHATMLEGRFKGPRSQFTMADILTIRPEWSRSVQDSWVVQKGWVTCWAARATTLAVLYINEANKRTNYTDRHATFEHGQFLMRHPFDPAPALALPHHFVTEGSASKARSGDVVRATMVNQTELTGISYDVAFPWVASRIETLSGDDIDREMAEVEGLSNLFTLLMKNEQELQRIEEKGQCMKTQVAEWSTEPPFTATFNAPTNQHHADYSNLRVREYGHLAVARVTNLHIIVTVNGVVTDLDMVAGYTKFTVEFPLDSSAEIRKHGLPNLLANSPGYYQLTTASNKAFQKNQIASVGNWPTLPLRGRFRKRFIAEVLMGQRKDPTAGSTELPHHHTLTPGMTAPLTQAQSGVAAAVLVDELPLVLCEGPPGTGKSRLIAQIIYQVIETGALFDTEPCILVCASSNKATDAIGQLIHQIQVAADANPTTAGLLRCVRMYTPSRELRLTACHQFALHSLALDPSLNGRTEAMQEAIGRYEDLLEEIRQYSLDGLEGAAKHEAILEHQTQLEELGALHDDLELQYLNWAKPNVIVVTCNATMDQRLDNLAFTHLVVDEVGQASFPQVLQAFSRLDSDACRQVLLVGDRHQLPPFSRSVGVAGTLIGLSFPQWLTDIEAVPNRRLLDCFRLHPAMLDFTASAVYNRPSQPENDLLTAMTPDQRALLLDRFPFPNRGLPLLFLAAEQGREGLSGSSRFNQVEANIVRGLVNFLTQIAHIPLADIGVLTFYEAQRVCIMSTLQSAGIAANREVVNNVDAFQGRERDVIILSCVRSSPDTDNEHTATASSREVRQLIGFTDFMNRCNVATSRAKHGLIIVGNPHTMKVGQFWATLFKFYGHRRCILEASSFNLTHFANTPAQDWYEANGRLKHITPL